jgi:hypothetical protein
MTDITVKQLQHKGQKFMEAGRDYYDACQAAGVRGAVVWFVADGRMCLFTRGEYTSTITKNIDDIGVPTVNFGAADD